MDTAAIIEIISTLGFPIACVVAMGAFVWKLYKRSEDREDKLMIEIGKTREVNEKAIDTIAHYSEKLDAIQKDISDIKTDITVIMTKE